MIKSKLIYELHKSMKLTNFSDFKQFAVYVNKVFENTVDSNEIIILCAKICSKIALLYNEQPDFIAEQLKEIINEDYYDNLSYILFIKNNLNYKLENNDKKKYF